MKLQILTFGIAQDIMNGKVHDKEYSVNTVQELKDKLCVDYPEFTKLRSISFAVNESYQSDEYILKENDTVAIIPPVAGG